MRAILSVSGLKDDSTPFVDIETHCSECRARVAATKFDVRNLGDLAELNSFVDARADNDGNDFLKHASTVHGVTRAELEPPAVVIL